MGSEMCIRDREMAVDCALQLTAKRKASTTLGFGVVMASRSGGGLRSMSYSFSHPTQSDLEIRDAIAKIFSALVKTDEYVRRFMVSLSGLVEEDAPRQLDLFLDDEESRKRERIQKAVLSIKGSFGKNAILKGMDYEEGATQRERNSQIGGHKSGS